MKGRRVQSMLPLAGPIISMVRTGSGHYPTVTYVVFAVLIALGLSIILLSVLAVYWYSLGGAHRRKAKVSVPVVAGLCLCAFIVLFLHARAHRVHCSIDMSKREVLSVNGTPNIILQRDADDRPFPLHKDHQGRTAKEVWVYFGDPILTLKIMNTCVFFSEEERVIYIDFFDMPWWDTSEEFKIPEESP